jgi:TatD DNase family protein
MPVNPLPELVDTHAHLEDEAFRADADAAVARARAAGVRYVIVPVTAAADCGPALELARRREGVFFAAGLHPNNGLPLDDDRQTAIRAALEEGKSAGFAVAVGECGLDYHYLSLPRAEQLAILKWHLALARDLDLPVILHQREAENDLRAVLEREGMPPRGAVLHCFSGDLRYYRWARAHGLHVSFTGSITFIPGKDTPAPLYFRDFDLARTMLETDAPYMTPVPHRGRRNEPANLPLVAAALAAKTARPVADVHAETTLAARAFFALPADFGGAVTYEFKNGLYLNITNRCTNDCVFCLRNLGPGVGSYDLRLRMEPTAGEILAAVGDPRRFGTIVFYGYGEPTIRWETVKEIARGIKDAGGRVRLDTNGSANLTAGRDVTAEMTGLIDKVSVSLNAGDADVYERVCRPAAGGRRAWEALAAFALGARKYVPEVELTAVNGGPADAEGATVLARKWGLPLRLRPYVGPT